MSRYTDITGKRFGRLTILSFDCIDEKQNSRWLCSCDCGSQVIVRRAALTGGVTKSCGCLQRERVSAIATKHGSAKTPEYQAWGAMRERCSNPNIESYADYGARGIRVHERWLSFENFLNDMGPRPSPSHSLDRIDNDGNYEPGNCRWATRAEQNRNTRRNRYIETPIGRMTLTDAAAAYGISPEGLRGRIRRGWDPKDLFEPLKANQSWRLSKSV